MKDFYYQQGDVLIVPLKKGEDIPSEAKVVQKGNQVVLAEGEVTGHAHRFFPTEYDKKTEPQILTYETRMYLNVPTGGVVKHEEHKPINLPGGEYLIQIVREYDHMEEETRQVAD